MKTAHSQDLLYIEQYFHYGNIIKTKAKSFSQVVYLDDRSTVSAYSKTEVTINGAIENRMIDKQVDVMTGILKVKVFNPIISEFKLTTPHSELNCNECSFWVICDKEKGDRFYKISGNILVKFMDSRDSWMSYVFYVIMIQTPILGAYLLLNGELTPSIPSTDSLPWIIGAGFFYTIALGLFPMAMQRIDAAVFGALEYTVLFWGTLFGFLLFSEVPDIWTIAGASIIVASGLFLVYRERRANHLVKELEGI